MMSKKSPQLRFEGFTDDWEVRKLSSGLREYTDRVIVEDDKEYYQISVRNNFGGITLRGSKMGNKIGRKRQAKINLTKYPQTLIFTRQTVEQGGIGWVDKYCDGAIVTENMPTISLDTSVFSKYFLTNLFQTRIFYKNAILDNIEGGSAQIAIHESKFLSSTLLFPNLDEQEKIGQFFKQLDNTIALHQRKLDLLKEQKKGYLQKMFPKNGAKVPELRFEGFADDWEERKLSDVANHRGGTAIEKYFDKYGVYKVISIGSYGLNSQYVDQNIRAISNEITDGRVVNSGELTMVLNDKTANGTIIGRTLLVEKDNEYVINQRTEIISPKENFDSNFAYTILNGPFREKVKRIVQGGTQIYVNYPAVSNLNLELPKIEEQQKIGSFFKQLDDTIALHQRKLDLLKEQKKGFLQKMFV
ncbi:restriction endonuclease subunit S [Lactococcus lactis]|uniref:restriction endonuclease subunit S n=2 Tax=Lactococcus TaxID=1357 RepID=UPI0021A47D68|nr:restriction endonuclease subunit S [Lactococcus lactis]MCT3126285.1 restriction endonuclease subunit S [Lactococcus lactis]